MSGSCRTEVLETWLEGALPPVTAAALEDHVRGCAACTHALAWLRLERSWMAQRARRTPPRPALAWEQLEARLRPPAPRARGSRAQRRAVVLAAAAALLLVVASVRRPTPPARVERAAGAGVEACVDTLVEAVSALERRVGACLVASPVVAQR